MMCWKCIVECNVHVRARMRVNYLLHIMNSVLLITNNSSNNDINNLK